jgi:hypothetical protein
MRAELRLWLALVLGCAAVPRTASAYCRSTTCNPETQSCAKDDNGCIIDGLPLFWGEPCVTVWVPDEDEPLPGIARATLAALTSAAFARWGRVECGGGRPAIDVQLGGALSCALTGYDPRAQQNVNTLRVVRDDWPHPGKLSAVALTTVTSLKATGEIVDADIELNAVHHRYTAGDRDVMTDLDSTLTHEAGHALGLGHSEVYEATMYESTRRGDTTLRTLHPDDEAGICATYPPQAGPAACAGSAASEPSRVCQAIVTPERRASACSVATPGASAVPGAWLALGCAVGLLARRRIRTIAS